MSNNYSSQDFTSIYEELLSIVEASTTRWSPRNSTEADPGVVILKLMALLEDKHNFKFDMAQSQAYLDSVSDRQYAFDLLLMLGYVMKGARSSTGDIQLSLKSPLPSDIKSITIPAGSVVTDATKTLRFFTTVEKTMTSTQQTISLRVQEGELFKITKEGIEEFTLKDINEDGKLYLRKSGLAQNGVFIRTVAKDKTESQDWSYIDFSIITPQGKHYTVETAEDKEMYVQFPENFETLVGDSHLAIYATYTKGSAGNILKNTLTLLENPKISEYVVVSQARAFYTGQEAESIEQATRNYYQTKDVCNTFVTASDFAAAIKYLLDENNNRLYSNVLIETALTKQKKIRSQYYGKEYTYQLPVSDSISQIDVTPLQASSDYVSSFKVAPMPEVSYPDSGQEPKVPAMDYISNQFAKQRALATIFKAKSGPRILAVTTPKMTIRISNYNLSSVRQLQEKIKNYLYSTFKAENLTPGVPLNQLAIEQSVKQLSPDIQSVSVQEFTYKTFSTYEPVDGTPSVRASISDNSTTTRVEGYQLEILADAALAGEVPVFKFYNRPNTPSKSNAGYLALAGTNTDIDIFNPVPFGTTGYKSFSSSKPIAPTVSNIISTLPYKEQKQDSTSTTAEGYIKLNKNHVLQLRRKLHRVIEDYGYGMQYSFWSDNNPKVLQGIQILYTSQLLEKSVLAGEEALPGATAPTDKASIIVVSENQQLDKVVSLWKKSATELAWTQPVGIALLEAGTQYALSTAELTIGQGGIALAKNSFIAAGSTIIPQSRINKFPFASYRIKDGIEYQLADDEKIYITKSDGTTVKTLEKGAWVLLKGLDLPSSGSTTSAVRVVENQYLQATQTISVLADDESIISTDFKYFLSLNTTSDTLDLAEGKSYMLDEGEALLYSDSSVSEYVTLGPGTILSAGTTLVGGKLTSNAGGKLENTPIAEIEAVSSEQFKKVPFIIHAQACEITTYLNPAIITKHSVETTTSFPTTWTGLSEKKNITVEKKNDNSTTVSTTYNSTDWDVRLAVKVETDENGVAPIEFPISFTLTYGLETDKKSSKITPDPTNAAYLVASTPFTSLLSEKSLLFPRGISASLSYCSIPPITSAKGFETSITTSSVTIKMTKEGGGTFHIPVATTGLPKMILATVEVSNSSSLEPTGSITISGEPLGGRIFGEGGQIKGFFTIPVKPDAFFTQAGRTFILSPATTDNGSTIPPSKLDNIVIAFSRNASLGATIKLSNLSYVLGYSDELLYTKDAAGQPLTAGSPDYFNEDIYKLNPESDPWTAPLIQKIGMTDPGKRFNWLCTPKELLQHPTASSSYFTPSHLLNSRTFPFIEFNAQEIKIIRGN